jgi:hypothetical protein
MIEKSNKEGLDYITYWLSRCSFYAGFIMSNNKLIQMRMRESKFQKLNFQLETKITKPILHKWIFFVTDDGKLRI